MIQYLNLLQTILEDGVRKSSGRPNMPDVYGISNAVIRMDLNKGFPLLTTKQMYWKGIIHELLWFLKGDTNIEYLVNNDVHIWDQDAYKWYLKTMSDLRQKPQFETIGSFIDEIKNYPVIKSTDGHYSLGDLGKVYGYQWRKKSQIKYDKDGDFYNHDVDQLADLINGLQVNPYSRYHIIDAWDKMDFHEMALPPCHLLYQFIVRPKAVGFYLDLNMYQRSCDTVVGVPFNLASMSLLLMIVAKTCNMKPGIATWIGGDVHIYLPHVDVVKEQLSRTPKTLPTIKINKELSSIEDIEDLTINDFILSDYQSYPAIKAELFTGLK